MSTSQGAETPFDRPQTVWERLTYPTLQLVYRDGWEAGAKATVDTLIELGFRK